MSGSLRSWRALWMAFAAAPLLTASAAAAPPRPAPPSVRAAALAGLGELAILQGGTVRLAGGAAGAGKAVRGAGTATDPQWSPDGAWLAYSRTVGSRPVTELWVVRADGMKSHRILIPGGSAAHPVSAVATTDGGVWSKADLLQTVAFTASGKAAGLWIASPGGGPIAARRPSGARYRTARPWELARGAESAMWAPGGRSLAYVVTLPAMHVTGRSDALYTQGLAGRPVRHLVARGDGIVLASFWPDGHGILYWLDPQHSASLAADGLRLMTLRMSTGKAPYLVTTLTYRRWIAWAPSGDTFTAVAGGPRLAWTNKTLVQCSARLPGEAVQACLTVNRPGGPIALDPAWGQSGLAYVRAANRGQNTWGAGRPSAFAAWQRSRTLWFRPTGSTVSRRLKAAGTDVSDPEWSKGGSVLLVARGRTLELVTPSTGRAVTVAHGVTPPQYPVGYYGYLDYGAVMAWSDAA